MTDGGAQIAVLSKVPAMTDGGAHAATTRPARALPVTLPVLRQFMSPVLRDAGWAGYFRNFLGVLGCAAWEVEDDVPRHPFVSPARSRTDVLRSAGPLTVDSALQTAMLLPQSEVRPDLRATTFD